MAMVSDVVSDETQDVGATLEFVTAITAHCQMLNDFDDSRLKQTGAGLGQRALGRSADQPLQLVAERVAEMFCQRNKAPSCPNNRKIFFKTYSGTYAGLGS